MKQIINGEVDMEELEDQDINWDEEVPEEIAAQDFIDSMAITGGN